MQWDQTDSCRYKGFSQMMAAFRRLGLLSTEPLPRAIEQWAEFLPSVMQARNAEMADSVVTDQRELQKALAA